MEPCLCGSYDCRSCGPAQGYSRCDAHKRMACETCWTCDCGEPAAAEGSACRAHTPIACCQCGAEIARREGYYDPHDSDLVWCSARCCSQGYIAMARAGDVSAVEACALMIAAIDGREVR